MSDMTNRLKAARQMAWTDLRPAFDLAISMAELAEHLAYTASIEVQTGIQPAYHPLVVKLSEAFNPEKYMKPDEVADFLGPPFVDYENPECCASGNCEVCRGTVKGS